MYALSLDGLQTVAPQTRDTDSALQGTTLKEVSMEIVDQME